MSAIYIAGADLADLVVTWKDTNGAVINFSSGWAFMVKVARRPDGPALFAKTSGITGAATAPNVTIAWSTTGELNGLRPGTYVLQITATRSADGKERTMQTPLQIKPAIDLVVADLPADGGAVDGGTP